MGKEDADPQAPLRYGNRRVPKMLRQVNDGMTATDTHAETIAGLRIISGPTHVEFGGRLYRWTDAMEQATARYTSAVRQIEADRAAAEARYRAAMDAAARALAAVQEPESAAIAARPPSPSAGKP